ncbi:MAG: hypothetical protein ACK5MH_06775 [Bacteroidales bacterium]
MKRFIFIALLAMISISLFAFESTQDYATLTAMALPLMGLSAYAKENCTIPEGELQALKAKYGRIKILSVVIEPPVYDENGKLTDKGETYYFAVRRPDPGHVRMLMSYAKNGDINKYVEVAIKNLIVAGDMEALEKDGLVYMGVSAQLDEVLKPYQSFLAGA